MESPQLIVSQDFTQRVDFRRRAPQGLVHIANTQPFDLVSITNDIPLDFGNPPQVFQHQSGHQTADVVGDEDRLPRRRGGLGLAELCPSRTWRRPSGAGSSMSPLGIS